ncbi:autotransporter assembly complex protein TamA [Cronobacter dublinensis]|uniref:autotransporter assembly complex protein TamA n=1 Tax=Cronobacter dublinensis TaxID=413497 RepID=UPI000CFD5516|nr:autotransporter assembly complex protein TamA [Cronobacter dublinensis]EGT4379668.1 autotransporter assembly complex protein TamA [Cronobacter dublinensis]EKM6455969.1 autotransporter assembly complex protein TamA [Cronobacter dublinensis]EKP4475038.1 autotransporter assembly complex protein TamA [Cronobacter dublinensis]EKY3203863.1 autotransporter assembly complex protein TamA [Cronobacter dublinensis]EKY3244247.1 autotransporter assembly complex protein TamA [Cronobacter dublinensis]
MPQIRNLCWAALLMASASTAAPVRLQVEGLSGALQKNVRAQLSTIQVDEVTPDRRFRARVDDAIRKGLKALGYYEPTIDFELREPPAGGRRQVLLARVSPGEPVRIGATNVILRGGARDDKEYLALLKKRPAVGTVLNHNDYDSFKKGLTSVALRRGYFDSEYKKSQLGVSVERRQAFWDIDYDSGTRYRFGDVTFAGSQIREEYLQNLVPFKKGDYYQSSDVAELSRRLSATGWFNSVVVAPEFEKSRQTKVLPLRGVVSPRIKNTVEVGAGYSTDVGPRLKANWRKPWINSYGHSLTTSTSISAPEQQLDFSYKMPLLKNPLEQYYLVQGGFKRTDLNDTEADSTTLAVSRYWDLSSGWQRAINLRWSLDHFTQANVTHTTMLLYPGVMLSRTRSRGGLMPTWGDSQRYSIDYSDTAWGSDVDFVVLQAQNAWIRTLYDKHRFVARGNLGWIETNDFERVPPDLRFFAGGDRSIRGYKYKSISPENDKGKLTGASKLATGSLEYQYNVTGKWWGAVFVDSGEAVNDIKQSNFKTGAGVGVRWQSPVGPIKLDFAVPVGDKEEHGLQFYIGLGPEL